MTAKIILILMITKLIFNLKVEMLEQPGRKIAGESCPLWNNETILLEKLYLYIGLGNPSVYGTFTCNNETRHFIVT